MKRIKENYKKIETAKESEWFELIVTGLLGYFRLVKKGWRLVEIRIFLLTNLYYSWKKLSKSDKINVIKTIITIVKFLSNILIHYFF